MYMSNYLANKLIDWLFRGQPFNQNLYMFVGLHRALGEEGNEVNAGGYNRAQIQCNLSSWAGTQGAGTSKPSSGASKLTTNNVAIQFPAPTEDWGNIVAIGIYDSDVGGNLLFYAPAGNAVNVVAGDEGPVIEVSQLRIILDS